MKKEDALKIINKKNHTTVDIFFILVMVIVFMVGLFVGRCAG